MILYLIYCIGLKSEEFIDNDYNGLWTTYEDDVKKGNIITSDGYVIAETLKDENGEEIRNYPYSNLFAHVTGYSDRGRTALEQKLNFPLLRSDASFQDKIVAELTGTKIPGNNAIATIRYDLQKVAYDALGDYDGAVVVIQPSTGKILTMVSKPDYNPNRINEDWEWIQQGSGLFNRATQG